MLSNRASTAATKNKIMKKMLECNRYIKHKKIVSHGNRVHDESTDNHIICENPALINYVLY